MNAPNMDTLISLKPLVLQFCNVSVPFFIGIIFVDMPPYDPRTIYQVRLQRQVIIVVSSIVFVLTITQFFIAWRKDLRCWTRIAHLFYSVSSFFIYIAWPITIQLYLLTIALVLQEKFLEDCNSSWNVCYAALQISSPYLYYTRLRPILLNLYTKMDQETHVSELEQRHDTNELAYQSEAIN